MKLNGATIPDAIVERVIQRRGTEHSFADLDPPRVIGYQLPGRGRRELRADRILRVDPARDDGELR